MYHGAEHKTITAYEKGLELTVENVRNQKRFHPRCGTSFLIIMVLVGILISFLIPPNVPTAVRVAIKIALIPVIMGIGYELIKLAGRHDNLFTRIISAPGVWLQHITVFEPTDDMIECAIEAITRVIPEDDSDLEAEAKIAEMLDNQLSEDDEDLLDDIGLDINDIIKSMAQQAKNLPDDSQ